MKPPILFTVSLAVLAVHVTIGGPSATQAQDASKLAQELTTLRGEVEAMSSQLTELKTEKHNQLRTYARQKSELVLELDREKMRLQKLRMAVASRQEEIDSEKARFKDVAPVFDATALALRAYIRQALPFRAEDRIADLDKLIANHRAGMLAAPKALARLWGMVEDEFRMTRESGMFQQTVTIRGREQLADVIRLGMSILYFKTADGQMGYATPIPSGWGYSTLSSQQDLDMLAGLFDSFKKHVRVGLFQLPNALGNKGQ